MQRRKLEPVLLSSICSSLGERNVLTSSFLSFCKIASCLSFCNICPVCHWRSSVWVLRYLEVICAMKRPKKTVRRKDQKNLFNEKAKNLCDEKTKKTCLIKRPKNLFDEETIGENSVCRNCNQHLFLGAASAAFKHAM